MWSRVELSLVEYGWMTCDEDAHIARHRMRITQAPADARKIINTVLRQNIRPKFDVVSGKSSLK